MSKTKKETKADKEARVLEDNVKVLQNGLYGYIYKGKAILESADYNVVNKFSLWVKTGCFNVRWT